MTVTAISNDRLRGSGVVQYLRSFDNTQTNVTLQVCQDMYDEIADLLYYSPGTTQFIQFAWFAQLNVIPDSYPSKLSSALNKFTFGCLSASWCGTQTFDSFINYEQQLIGDFISSSTTLGKLYPDEPDIPERIDDCYIYALPGQLAIGRVNRADTLYIDSLSQYTGDIFIRCWYYAISRDFSPPASVSFFNTQVYYD